MNQQQQELIKLDGISGQGLYHRVKYAFKNEIVGNVTLDADTLCFVWRRSGGDSHTEEEGDHSTFIMTVCSDMCANELDDLVWEWLPNKQLTLATPPMFFHYDTTDKLSAGSSNTITLHISGIEVDIVRDEYHIIAKIVRVI